MSDDEGYSSAPEAHFTLHPPPSAPPAPRASADGAYLVLENPHDSVFQEFMGNRPPIGLDLPTYKIPIDVKEPFYMGYRQDNRPTAVTGFVLFTNLTDQDACTQKYRNEHGIHRNHARIAYDSELRSWWLSLGEMASPLRGGPGHEEYGRGLQHNGVHLGQLNHEVVDGDTILWGSERPMRFTFHCVHIE